MLAMLACLFGAFLGFQYSSDVVLSYFELLYVREENVGAALIYATSTLLAVGIVSRYWGLIPGFTFGLIPLVPTIRATFADDLGGFGPVVSMDAGSFMVVFAAASALVMNLLAAMLGHERAKGKADLSRIRFLARGHGGPWAMAILTVLSLVAFATVQTAMTQLIVVNAR